MTESHTHKVEDQEISVFKDPGESGGSSEEPQGEPYKSYATKAEHEAALEAALKDRLERKDKKLAEEKAETERKAREKALEDQENFKALSEQRGEELVGLKTQTQTLEGERDAWRESAEAYEEILGAQWEARKEGVPDYVLDAIAERPLVARLKYLDEHAEKFGQPNTQRPAGSRPTGRPGTPPRKEQDKEARENQRRARVSAI